MAVQTVVGDVEGAVAEPFEEGCFRIVQHHRWLVEPGDSLLRLCFPKAEPVGLGFVVHGWLRVGSCGESSRRRKLSFLRGEVGDGWPFLVRHLWLPCLRVRHATRTEGAVSGGPACRRGLMPKTFGTDGPFSG